QLSRGRCNWWRGWDLNARPSGYEPDELPNCSTPRRRHDKDSVTVIGGPTDPGNCPEPDAAAYAGTTMSTQIRTFQVQRGRLRTRRRMALSKLGPRYGVEVTGGPLDPVAVFGRQAPLVLEIGSGMGTATAAMAEADPDRNYLAAEVHTPGVANLLLLIEERRLTNLRVAHGDALELLRQRIPPDSLDAVL